MGLFSMFASGSRKAIFTGLSLTTLAVASFLPAKPAQALVTTASIVPSWNTTAVEERDISACISHAEYMCEVGLGQTVYTYTENASGCNDLADTARAGMRFDLGSIPATAMVTKVELTVTVQEVTSSTQTVRRIANDTPDQLMCQTGSTFAALAGTGNPYGTFANWGSLGTKNLDLGSQAVSDVQQRLTGSQSIALSIVANSDASGAIYSAEATATSNRPALKVTYSTTPDAPTNFSLSGRAPTSLTWFWIENGWAENQNLVRDDAQATRCDAGPVSGIGNSVACTETNLLPNTLYARHPAAVDPAGATNGLGTAASTAIETPTGVIFTSRTQSAISLVASGPLSNLTRAFSGVLLAETNTGQASGWSQTNGWSMAGLQANTPYVFRAQARNGDGAETLWSAGQQIFTLSLPAQIQGARAANTWYPIPEFSFSNAAGWGPGGVEYYRYAWNGSPTYAFTGSEPTWSNVQAGCPSGQCVNVGETLTLGSWHNVPFYLHVQPYNGDGVLSAGATSGPYLYDAEAPNAPTTASLSNRGNSKYTSNLNMLTAAWSGGSDSVSGLREFEYALGTTPGGTDVRGFQSAGLNTSAVLNNLTLKNGAFYYLSVRTLDWAGHLSPATISPPILANTLRPAIIDRQNGDVAHRRLPGTTYNVDFQKAGPGPALQSAQYTVYSKPNLGGKLVMNWTAIFNGARDSFTNNWTANFPRLREGTNYVTVRTTSLDGLETVQRDAFVIVKDTAPAPHIRGLLQATFPARQPSTQLLIVGQGFKSGAKVYVGTMRATRVTLNKFGQLLAQVPISRIGAGRYNLRVVNPNGLSAVRTNKVFITSG